MRQDCLPLRKTNGENLNQELLNNSKLQTTFFRLQFYNSFMNYWNSNPFKNLKGNVYVIHSGKNKRFFCSKCVPLCFTDFCVSYLKVYDKNLRKKNHFSFSFVIDFTFYTNYLNLKTSISLFLSCHYKSTNPLFDKPSHPKINQQMHSSMKSIRPSLLFPDKNLFIKMLKLKQFFFWLLPALR